VTARRLGTLGLAAFLLFSGRCPLHAQSRWLTGYVQTVPLWTDATPLTEGAVSDFNRVRLMAEPTIGPLSISAAYEHVATFRQRPTQLGTGLGSVPGGGEWLKLQWTIRDREHVLWQHRFDRLQVGWSPTRAVDLTVGRQAISWGTTLFLTPADPFVPFNPADPFREFRAGVDAARVRVYPSPLSEIDLVVRPTKTAVGEELTALARGLATWKNWEISGWGGTLYGDPAGAFGAAGSVGAWAVRGEGVVRGQGTDVAFRGTIGLDHLSQLKGRDLYFVVEYQRDGLGAGSPQDYPRVLGSDTFRRGEQQVLGRDETVVQTSYKVHPLWSIAGLWLWNLDDRSALVSPSFTYSASNEVSISGAVFFGLGNDRITPTRSFPSEYGLAGTTAFVSVSWFF
jgi:hypothetical protein